MEERNEAASPWEAGRHHCPQSDGYSLPLKTAATTIAE